MLQEKGQVVAAEHVHPRLRSAIEDFVEKRDSLLKMLVKEAPLSLAAAAFVPGGVVAAFASVKRFNSVYKNYLKAHDFVSQMIFSHKKITRSDYSARYKTYELVKKYDFVAVKEDGSLHFVSQPPSKKPLWLLPLVSKKRLSKPSKKK
ncbi:MAG: hypothetical protein ACP5O3_03310 [Candidatus Micrarchaeia archaeon]